MPTLDVPSSPASATKITSRSNGTLRRFSSNIVMRLDTTCDLSSEAPRPHHVGVTHDDDGALGTVALNARNQIGAFGIEGEYFRLDAGGLQYRLKIIDGLSFIAGRIAGIDPKQGSVVAHRFRFELAPIDSVAVGSVNERHDAAGRNG